MRGMGSRWSGRSAHALQRFQRATLFNRARDCALHPEKNSAFAQRAAQLGEFGAELHDLGFERGETALDFGRQRQ